MGVHRTDAADQLQVDVTGEFGRVNGVEVVKEWAIIETILSRVETAALGPSPGNFGPDAKIVPKEHVAANARISATAQRLEDVPALIYRTRPRR